MADRWRENDSGVDRFLESEPELYAALYAAAAPALAAAKALAPVRTGAYRRSIRVERREDGPGLVFFSDDPKAHWIEYGAQHTRRQRVLGRAAELIRA